MLSGTATRVTDANGRVGVVPTRTHVTEAEMRRLYVKSFERNSLARDELQMLREIIDGAVLSDTTSTWTTPTA